MKTISAMILVIISACVDRTPRLPIIAYVPFSDIERHDAITAYSSELNTRLNCAAVTITDKPGNLDVRWSTVNEMRETFHDVKAVGMALSIPNRRVRQLPTNDEFEALEFWFAVDYPGALPDEIGRVWLHWVAWMAGLPATSTDKESISYEHPTWAADPVAALINGLGGAEAAAHKLCSPGAANIL